MKTKITLSRLFLMGLLFALLLNCKKKEVIQTAPTVTISAVTNITGTSATSGGDVASDGGSTVTAKGVCWGTKQNPTTSDSKTDNGPASGSFASSITGLNPATTYTIRAYAINTIGTAYSSQSTFTTVALAPVLTTTDIKAMTSAVATSGGNISADGGSAVTARGVCWATTQDPTTANSKTTDGFGSGIFTSILTGLLPSTTYYVKAYATNSIGTTYGNQLILNTIAVPPTLTTTTASVIDFTTATSGGNISSDGGSAVTARGVCYATTQNVYPGANSKTTDGAGTGIFTSNLSGLIPGTNYYLKAYATNSAGTGYGDEISFKTLAYTHAYGLMSDNDGNVYWTITIGTQVWMAENLKTTKYRNGDAIPNITGNTAWGALVSGAYCWYNDDAATYKAVYGALYNWYAVSDSRNIAPVGWHVPTDAEWTTLITFLGGEAVAGAKLKETGSKHWWDNLSSTNSSGFTALPGGQHGHRDGSFSFVNLYAYGPLWSSSLYDSSSAWIVDMTYGSTHIYHSSFYKEYGASVRLVKD